MPTLRQSIIAASLFLLSLPIHADVHFSLDQFEKAASTKVSMLTANGSSFAKVGFSPDFAFGPVSLGVDANLYIPLSGGGYYPTELNTFVLRRLAYDHNRVAGVEYGWLKNVTYGQGLLMNNYDSGSGGITDEFANEKAGVKGYARINEFTINAMYTASSVQAARLTYDMPFIDVMGAPLRAGVTYVKDSNGIDRTLDGRSLKRPEQAGYGVDLSLPIAGDFLTLYSEYAKLENHGSGASAGVRGDVFGMLGYKAEFRSLGASFVPEYFNRTYEATSFDFATDTAKKSLTGFLLSAYSSVVKDYVRAGLEYEVYESKNLLSAAVGWQRIMDTVGVINYSVPFQTGGQAVLTSDIAYYTNTPIDYVVHWKQVPIDANTKTESYSVELRFNLQKIFPGFPF